MNADKPTVTPVEKFKPYKKKSDSKKYTAVCLTAIGVCLVGSGIALIIVGVEYDIEDLLILGPIFLVAGIGFTILMFYIIVTQLYEKKERNKLKNQTKKEKKAIEKIEKLNLHNNSAIGQTESKPYIEDVDIKVNETKHVHKLNPKEKQLYGTSSVIGHVRANEVQPLGHIEVNEEPNVYSANKNDDILTTKTTSVPPKNKLYGEPARFSLSSSPSPPPISASSGRSTFSNDIKPLNQAESPIPSFIEYTLPNEVPDEAMSYTGSPVPPAGAYILPNDIPGENMSHTGSPVPPAGAHIMPNDIYNLESESSHL